MPELTPGTVLSYTPSQHHCREGLACVDDRGVARDTFWRTGGDSESHVLTGKEIASATVVFNVGEFVALDRYSSGARQVWETYHPDDRAWITSQHGLQEALFVRRGASPHLGTQIENARAAVATAQSSVRVAEHELERRRSDLSALLERSTDA